jgi:hypothetical protein
MIISTGTYMLLLTEFPFVAVTALAHAGAWRPGETPHAC